MLRKISYISVYFATVNAIYALYIVEYWRYMGFELRPSLPLIAMSYALVGLIFVFQPAKIQKPSDLFLALFTSLVTIPYFTIASWGGGPIEQIALPALVSLILIISNRTGEVRLAGIRGGESKFKFLSLCLSIIYLAYVIINGGLQNLNFDILQVYDYREAQKDNLSGLFNNYIGNWVTKIIIPAAVVYFFASRQYPLSAFFLIVSIILFGAVNLKITAVLPWVVLAIFLLLKRGLSADVIILAFGCFFSFCVAIFFLFGDHILASFLVRRAIFIPAQNFVTYFEYFTDEGFVVWSNSILSPFLDYTHKLSPSELIGEYDGTGNHVNNGFVATGYMHMGYGGVLIYGILVALILKLLDGAARGPNGKLVTAISAAPLLHTALNVDLLTALATHGLFLIVIVALLLQNSKNKGRLKQWHMSRRPIQS